MNEAERTIPLSAFSALFDGAEAFAKAGIQSNHEEVDRQWFEVSANDLVKFLGAVAVAWQVLKTVDAQPAAAAPAATEAGA